MTEHDEQAVVIEWARFLEGMYLQLKNLFAIPNAGKRSVGAGRYMVAEGLKTGVPDLFLAWPTGGKAGLFIEMKAGSGKLSVDQGDWIWRLKNAGYAAAVCYSADEAISAIKEYLNIIE